MDGAAGFDAIFNEGMDAGGGRVLDHPHANATDTFSVRLRCDYDQSLIFHAPPGNAFL